MLTGKFRWCSRSELDIIRGNIKLRGRAKETRTKGYLVSAFSFLEIDEALSCPPKDGEKQK